MFHFSVILCKLYVSSASTVCLFVAVKEQFAQFNGSVSAWTSPEVYHWNTSKKLHELLVAYNIKTLSQQQQQQKKVSPFPVVWGERTGEKRL